MKKDIISIVKKSGIKAGPPRLTRYEKARVISARALQLELGAFPLIDVTALPKDPIEIAKEELKKGVLPFTLIRSLPNGEKELVPVGKLIELEKELFGFVEI
jgi:DNA-directed RNA polymerase subunit K